MASYCCKKKTDSYHLLGILGFPDFETNLNLFPRKDIWDPGRAAESRWALPQHKVPAVCVSLGRALVLPLFEKGPGDQCHGLNVTVGETILSLKWKSYNGYIIMKCT